MLSWLLIAKGDDWIRSRPSQGQTSQFWVVTLRYWWDYMAQHKKSSFPFGYNLLTCYRQRGGSWSIDITASCTTHGSSSELNKQKSQFTVDLQHTSATRLCYPWPMSVTVAEKFIGKCSLGRPRRGWDYNMMDFREECCKDWLGIMFSGGIWYLSSCAFRFCYHVVRCLLSLPWDTLRDADIHSRKFSVFSQSLQANVGVVAWNRRLPLPHLFQLHRALSS